MEALAARTDLQLPRGRDVQSDKGNETDDFFDQVTDKNYNEHLVAKAKEIYGVGRSLVEAVSDITEPIFEEQPDGPKVRTLHFHDQALQEAGLSESIVSGHIELYDEAFDDVELRMEPPQIEIQLSRMHEAEDIVLMPPGPDEDSSAPIQEIHGTAIPTGETNTVVITDHLHIHSPESELPTPTPFDRGMYDHWPYFAGRSHVDFQGRNIMPFHDRGLETPIHSAKGGFGMDVTGGDKVLALLAAEARIRGIDLQ